MTAAIGRPARRLSLRLWVTVALSGAAPALALAQATTATLTGTVRTAAGSPVEGAVVEARSTSTGVTRTAVTGGDGRFVIDLLQPGTWSVSARHGGQALGDPRSVTLRLQQTAVVDFLAGTVATETVTVGAERPLVDRNRIESGLRLEGAQLEQLPVDGRTLTDLAMLDSSITATPQGNFYGERGSVFVVNGQSGRANSFLVDGLDNNDQASNTTMNAFLSQLVIGEFLVLKHQYAPEFGRASGGILNVVTQRGGNEVQGSGFFQGSAAGLNSPGEFVSSLPDRDEEQDSSGRYAAGARVGGPLLRDTASYFAAFEHQESEQVTPYTGVARDGIAGGWILAPNRDDNLFLRGDFNLGSGQFLMTRLSFDDRSTDGLNVGGDVTPEAGFTLDERDVQLAASLTSVFPSGLLNEARLLVGRSSFDQNANSDRPGVERPSGTFGGNNLNVQSRDEDRIQLVDNFSWERGRHAFKVGGDVLRSRTDVATSFNPNGNFLYDTDDPFEPGDCGDLLISMLDPNDPKAPIPCPGQVGVDDDGDGVVDEPGFIYTYPFVFQLIEGSPEATLDDTRYGLFAQDTWRAGDHWLLNYGLRYDLSTFTLPADAVVDSSIPNGGAGRDTNNLAPRFGFAWTPGSRGRLVVRGGSGIFYDKLVLGFPAVAAITSDTRIGLFFPQGLTIELTEDVVEQLGIDVIKPNLFFPEELTLRFSTGTEMDTPYTVQHSLGMEQAMGSHGTFSASVTRALGHNLVLMRDLNPVVGINVGGAIFPVDPDVVGIPVHRDPNVGSIAAMVTEGRSWYTGLDLGFRWGSDDSWYSMSYTFAKAIDMGPDPLKGGIYLPPDSDDIDSERGRSDSDRRHRFVFSASSSLPWLGLRASGVVQAASGIPFNVTTGRDENRDGITTDRPRGVVRNSGANTDLRGVNDLRKAQGLPEIDSLTEPTFSQIDLKLSRPFGLAGSTAGSASHAGTGGELFVQVFNLLDEHNAGSIEGAATSTRFGQQINLAGPPRTIELGVKVSF